ncbi:hypothetical protein J3R83DRAFT_10143 [Lanmaoa asiatica]|nr:hypothetical protein J3R83DRAFT_10143 [Lanmaoa asiatica]
MRYMSDMLDGQTEGTRDVSWIWKMPGVLDNSEKGLQDSLRIEWCKARARVERWDEEVILREEMWRIEAFFDWEKEQWLQRACTRTLESEADREGSAAYTKRQAALREWFITAGTALWASIPVATAEELK